MWRRFHSISACAMTGPAASDSEQTQYLAVRHRTADSSMHIPSRQHPRIEIYLSMQHPLQQCQTDPQMQLAPHKIRCDEGDLRLNGRARRWNAGSTIRKNNTTSRVAPVSGVHYCEDECFELRRRSEICPKDR
jgi:hypothetical protein